MSLLQSCLDFSGMGLWGSFFSCWFFFPILLKFRGKAFPKCKHSWNFHDKVRKTREFIEKGLCTRQILWDWVGGSEFFTINVLIFSKYQTNANPFPLLAALEFGKCGTQQQLLERPSGRGFVATTVVIYTWGRRWWICSSASLFWCYWNYTCKGKRELGCKFMPLIHSQGPWADTVLLNFLPTTEFCMDFSVSHWKSWKRWPQVPYPHNFWTLPGMASPPLPWASCSNAWQPFPCVAAVVATAGVVGDPQGPSTALNSWWAGSEV